ncbi:MAG: hypothetical protein A3E01_15315 [Gammaproteobacteria bacterium RIFCSPHIGHO2_12_FULL_63_22]|nr:MAG: hypothetical protein A3E01_15315 [Gammaproteobacteria bacterium RIFCSPHIGHO2_12_FULL_63_22]
MSDDTLTRIHPYTRQTFLRRLERLLRMRRDYRDDLNALGFCLLDRAIATTIEDCAWCGAAGAAQTLVDAAESQREPTP